jgi:hypothetical protein
MKNQLSIASWESETRFDVTPHESSGFRRFSSACAEMLHQLKETITSDLASRFAGTLRPEFVRQVVNEADALAATTGFPALFLPTLAEEKVEFASEWQARQRLIQERSWRLAA